MRKIVTEQSFLKDWKKLEKKHYNKQALLDIVQLLAEDAYLPGRYHDHALLGDWQGFRECHIRPDWLLIYRRTPTEIILVATGTHDDLFE